MSFSSSATNSGSNQRTRFEVFFFITLELARLSLLSAKRLEITDPAYRSNAFSREGDRRIYRHWRVARIVGQFVRRSLVHSAAPSVLLECNGPSRIIVFQGRIYRKFVVGATTPRVPLSPSVSLPLSSVPQTTICSPGDLNLGNGH